MYMLEVLTAIAIYVLGFFQSIMSNFDKHAQTNKPGLRPEQKIPLFFTIYAFCCLLRLYRFWHLILSPMPQIRYMRNAVFNFPPFFINLFSMFLCVFVVFAQMGVHLFGGKINSNTPN